MKNRNGAGFFGEELLIGEGNAHIDAVFKNGKFYDFISKKEIKFEYDEKVFPDGIHLKIISPLSFLEPESMDKHLERKTFKLLDKGSVLYFGILDLSFLLELEEDLYLLQIGNRSGKLSYCKCKVSGAEDWQGKALPYFPVKEYNSLNQAYTRTSIHFFPERNYHTGNAFKQFYTKDLTKLESLRHNVWMKLKSQ